MCYVNSILPLYQRGLKCAQNGLILMYTPMSRIKEKDFCHTSSSGTTFDNLYK